MSAQIINFPVVARTPSRTSVGSQIDEFVAFWCEIRPDSDPEVIRRRLHEIIQRMTCAQNNG